MDRQVCGHAKKWMWHATVDIIYKQMSGTIRVALYGLTVSPTADKRHFKPARWKPYGAKLSPRLCYKLQVASCSLTSTKSKVGFLTKLH